MPQHLEANLRSKRERSKVGQPGAPHNNFIESATKSNSDLRNKPNTNHTKPGYCELLACVEIHTRELRGRDKDTTL